MKFKFILFLFHFHYSYSYFIISNQTCGDVMHECQRGCQIYQFVLLNPRWSFLSRQSTCVAVSAFYLYVLLHSSGLHHVWRPLPSVNFDLQRHSTAPLYTWADSLFLSTKLKKNYEDAILGLWETIKRIWLTW